jgi:hypothetical protein
MYFTGKGGGKVHETMETWKDASGRWVARKGCHIVAVGALEQEAKEELSKVLSFLKDPNRYRHS